MDGRNGFLNTSVTLLLLSFSNCRITLFLPLIFLLASSPLTFPPFTNVDLTQFFLIIGVLHVTTFSLIFHLHGLIVY